VLSHGVLLILQVNPRNLRKRKGSMTHQRRMRICWKRGEGPIRMRLVVFLLGMRTPQKE